MIDLNDRIRAFCVLRQCFLTFSVAGVLQAPQVIIAGKTGKQTSIVPFQKERKAFSFTETTRQHVQYLTSACDNQQECTKSSNQIMDTRGLFVVLLALVGMALAEDVFGKSIVYDKKTPDVFYCPQEKHTGFHKMIVKSRSLAKLCEFDGKPVPPGYKSDCYDDVDESEYACNEKQRILALLKDNSADYSNEIHEF